MKLFLQRVWTRTPDQVMSTVVLVGAMYVVWHGAIAVWHNPPSPTFCLVVIGIGMVLGVIASMEKNDKTLEKTNMDR